MKNIGDLGVREKRDHEVKTRLTPSDYRLIEDYRKQTGLKMADFLRLAACKMLQEERTGGSNEL